MITIICSVVTLIIGFGIGFKVGLGVGFNKLLTSGKKELMNKTNGIVEKIKEKI